MRNQQSDQQRLNKITDKFDKAQNTYIELLGAIFSLPPTGNNTKKAVHNELMSAYNSYRDSLTNLHKFTEEIING